MSKSLTSRWNRWTLKSMMRSLLCTVGNNRAYHYGTRFHNWQSHKYLIWFHPRAFASGATMTMNGNQKLHWRAGKSATNALETLRGALRSQSRTRAFKWITGSGRDHTAHHCLCHIVSRERSLWPAESPCRGKEVRGKVMSSYVVL